MSKRAEKAALEAFPPHQALWNRYAKRNQSEKVDVHTPMRAIFIKGYHQAEKDVIALIESRIGEILGDAQPKPILRIELRDLIRKINE